MKKKKKEIFIAVTNREYKGIQGYEIVAVSHNKEKVMKAFAEWKQDRLNEFAGDIEENGDIIEVENNPMGFLYNDNNRYYISGCVSECPCTADVKDTAYVALVGGLSDGNDVEDYKVFSTHQGAVSWMRNQIFDIKSEWEKDGEHIAWEMDEKRDSTYLNSYDVSVEVFGFVSKLGVL